jgi:hypothetical protein
MSDPCGTGASKALGEAGLRAGLFFPMPPLVRALPLLTRLAHDITKRARHATVGFRVLNAGQP